jgi:hypothetical protein
MAAADSAKQPNVNYELWLKFLCTRKGGGGGGEEEIENLPSSHTEMLTPHSELGGGG